MYSPHKTSLHPVKLVSDAWSRGMRFPKPMSVLEWADERRHVAPGMSPLPGKWRTSKMPHLAEIMECLSPSHPCRSVTFVGASQTSGKTDSIINLIGYHIDHDPRSILLVMPNHKQIKRISGRIEKTVACTPSLAARLSLKSRDRANSIEQKDYEGGSLYLGSAESPSDLAMISVPVVIGDEIDRWPSDLSGEGDPVELARARANAYKIRKEFWTSTPTIEAISPIMGLYNASDQRERWVPCPECNEFQTLKWSGLRWPNGKPLQAAYACEHCGALLGESAKLDMLPRGVWRALFPERSSLDVGFRISSLYSPLGFGKSWAELAEKWLSIQGDRTKLQVFANTVLAETWRDNDDRVDDNALKALARPVPLRIVPEGFYLVTFGVDVQKDRWEVVMLAHSPSGARAIVEHAVLYGDTADLSQWDAVLEPYLRRPLTTAAGASIVPRAGFIDSGHLQHTVVMFTRQHQREKWYASKGSSNQNASPVSKPTYVDIDWRGQKITKGAQQFQIGQRAVKDVIFGALALCVKRSKDGVSSIDLPLQLSDQLSDEFYKQVTSEVFDPHKGRYVVLPGRRNEALDCMVLAIAAAIHPNVNVDRIRASEWDLLKQACGYGQADLFSQPTPNNPTAPVPQPASARPNANTQTKTIDADSIEIW